MGINRVAGCFNGLICFAGLFVLSQLFIDIGYLFSDFQVIVICVYAAGLAGKFCENRIAFS